MLVFASESYNPTLGNDASCSAHVLTLADNGSGLKKIKEKWARDNQDVKLEASKGFPKMFRGSGSIRLFWYNSSVNKWKVKKNTTTIMQDDTMLG